eukprot:8350-Heterococcus_DN1.PRE.1
MQRLHTTGTRALDGVNPGVDIRALPLVGSTEWWEAKGRGHKLEHPSAWHAPDTAFGRAVGNLRTWKKGEPDLTKLAGSDSDLDELLATASERK